jgi:hypothetical protein
VGVFTRKAAETGAAPPEDPDLAALPAEAQPRARQALGEIKAEKDPVRLKEQLEQMRGQAGQVPPQVKPIFDLLLKRAEERLAELEKEKGKQS